MSRRVQRKTITLADVAAEVGLSPAAASLALRGKPGVADSTRDRVLEAARKLGYLPQPSGVARGRDPLTVMLVIRALPESRPAANVFYGPILFGIEERCRKLQIRLMFAVLPVDEHNHPLEIPPLAADRRIDGLILVGADLGHRTDSLLGDRLDGGRLPAVLVDGYADDDGLDSVDIDNVSGARTAVRYLVDRGHREIAMLGTEPDAFPSILERRIGYAQVLAEVGLAPRFVDVPFYDSDRAAAAGVEYLLANPHVTAIFCANDLVAITLIQAAQSAGISVPDQVSVMGFDDIELAGLIAPGLTTMAVDKQGMGQLAVSLLLHRLEVERGWGTTALIRPRLVERASVRTIGADIGPYPRLVPASAG